MKRSEIYLKAAELITQGNVLFACYAITDVSGIKATPEAFPELFVFRTEMAFCAWLNWQYNSDEEIDLESESEETLNFKSTVLLFASELAKDTNN